MTASAPPSVPARKPYPLLRLLLLCLLGVAVPLAGLLVWHVLSRLSHGSAVRRLEAAARQRGEPLTLAELATNQPPVPEADNAAVALMELWEKEDPAFWRAFHEGRRPLPEPIKPNYDPALPGLGRQARTLSRRQPLDPAGRKAAESWVAAQQEHLRTVRQALQRPQGRFPLCLSESVLAPMPHLAALKTEATRLQVASLLALDQGDAAQALAAVVDTARLANLLADEPILLSQWVRVACLHLSLNGLERVFSRLAVTTPQLEPLRLQLDAWPATNVVRRMFLGERVMALSMFDLPTRAFASSVAADGQPQLNPEQEAAGFRLGLGVMNAVGLLSRDRRLMLETFERAVTLADQDTPQALQETEEAFRKAADQARQFPPRFFSGLLLPPLEKARGKLVALEARRWCALVAVAVERYRVEKAGALPEKLQDLIPQFLSVLPADPYDGQPLRYGRRPQGYVVYSVGHDRQDHQGLERPAKGPRTDCDETFIVER
jgi:hypothetical protein